MRARRLSSKTKRRAVFIFRIVLIGSLLALIGLVVAYLIRPSTRPPAIRPEAKPLSGPKADVQENIDFTRDEGGRNWLNVKAGQSYKDENGMIHFVRTDSEPWVRIKSGSRTGGREFEMKARHAVVDANWSRPLFEGEVEIYIDDIVVKGPAFNYDRTNNIMTSDAPTVFEGKRFQGTGRKSRFDVDRNILSLTEGVTLTMSPWPNDQIPLILNGDELTYERGERKGKLRGNVTMSHGKSRGRSDEVQFFLFPDRDGFRIFDFRGGVAIDVEDETAAAPAKKIQAKPEAAADEDLIFFQGGRRRLEAGIVTLLPYGDEDWLHLIALRDGSSFTIRDDQGRRTSMASKEMDFYYNRDGTLRNFILRERASVIGETEGRSRLLEGNQVDYESSSRRLIATGTGENRAHSISRGRDVTADSVTIWLSTNDLDILGGVKIVSTPQPGERTETAFFSGKDKVFITANSASFSAGQHRFLLKGRVRLWQGRESLEASEVTIREDTGEISAAGSARSVFFQRPKGKELDSRVEVVGDRLVRDPKSGRVIYSGACSMSVADIVMKAGRLILDPAVEAGKYSRIFADRERIFITQRTRTAEGDRVEYDLDADTIVVTGRPILRDKEKGTNQGEKLTFTPADGKIRIENPGAERSTTIIKS
jgi:lipopolysaccharide export system protein LptA